MCSSHVVASKASAVSAVTTTCAHWVPSFRAGIRVHLMTLQRVSQNCLRSSAAHSGCIPPTKYAFLFMPGAPSSLPSGLFGCCSGADSFFRLRFEVSTHSLFSTDCILSFLFSSDVSGLVFPHFRAYASSPVCPGSWRGSWFRLFFAWRPRQPPAVLRSCRGVMERVFCIVHCNFVYFSPLGDSSTRAQSPLGNPLSLFIYLSIYLSLLHPYTTRRTTTSSSWKQETRPNSVHNRNSTLFLLSQPNLSLQDASVSFWRAIPAGLRVLKSMETGDSDVIRTSRICNVARSRRLYEKSSGWSTPEPAYRM